MLDIKYVPLYVLAGSKFLLPHAVDADSRQNSLQGYRLTEVSPDHPGLFFLDTATPAMDTASLRLC